nr:hypothetical protein [Tanacetum cinerariifolium]
SSEPSNDNTNVANALLEPFVGNQDPGKNSLQSPLQINHHCCYECGDPIEDIYCHQCTCELCGRGDHYGYNCPLKVPVVPTSEPFNNQTYPVIHQLIREKTCAELIVDEQEANIDTQPFQYSVVPQPPQEEMSVEFLRERRNQMDSVKTFLRKFN